MICLLKILCIFEVLFILISNDANTGTKTKDRRTVASTAVILMHRMGVDSSDLSPLFNQKSFIMLSTNDKRAHAPDLAIVAERNHQKNRFSLVDSYLKMAVPELVSDLIVEMNAKNKAYYFILESDLYEEFRAYCERRES